jgi:hypothetical protein
MIRTPLNDPTNRLTNQRYFQIVRNSLGVLFSFPLDIQGAIVLPFLRLSPDLLVVVTACHVPILCLPSPLAS